MRRICSRDPTSSAKGPTQEGRGQVLRGLESPCPFLWLHLGEEGWGFPCSPHPPAAPLCFIILIIAVTGN